MCLISENKFSSLKIILVQNFFVTSPRWSYTQIEKEKKQPYTELYKCQTKKEINEISIENKCTVYFGPNILNEAKSQVINIGIGNQAVK
jgi:hypothetical protein